MRDSLFLLVMLAGGTFSHSLGRCGGSGNVTTYMRSEGTRLMEFSTKTLKQQTLNQCADTCTSQAKGDCSSFEYDAKNQECNLHAEDGQPFGPSVLSRAETTSAFFQNICVQERDLCASPYSFERFPQSILVGHSMVVNNTNGLSDCLSLCLSAFRSQNVECRSLMYFYETGECILNRDTRLDQAPLFQSGIRDTLVDYFENNCFDVSCPSGSTMHWVRTEEFSISHEKDVIIESMSIEECRAVCKGNAIGAEKFPCKAFAYSPSKQECHLSAESGYTGRRNQSHFDLNPINTGEYFEKFCLKTQQICLEASFELVPNRVMKTDAYKTISTTSAQECLSVCIEDGPMCATVIYYFDKDECELTSMSQFSHPELFSVAENTAYYDKICDAVPSRGHRRDDEVTPIDITVDTQKQAGTKNIPVDSANTIYDTDQEELQRPDVDQPNSSELAKVSAKAAKTETTTTMRDYNDIDDGAHEAVDQTETEAEGMVVDESVQPEEQSREAVKGHLTTECRMSGVTIAITFGTTTSGAVYIKDNFATCNTEFTNATDTELHIPFPHSDEEHPRCPGTELSPNHWSFLVVVQKNEMSSPSLLTSTDRIFNITCDYSSILATQAPPPSSAEAETEEESLELKSKKVKMEILRNGLPVTTVPLGEEVELKWTVVEASNSFGFFVNECVAQRVGGSPPEPEPLKIIYQGCPDEKVKNRLLSHVVTLDTHGEKSFSTRMRVFRFDGSRRVRIKCTIDVCVESCPPVACEGLESHETESFGRKKRQSMEDLALLLGKLKNVGKQQKMKSVQKSSKTATNRRSRIVTGTLTITDRATKENMRKPRPEFSSLSSSERVCLLRWHVVSAIVTICILFVIVLFSILNVLHRRCSKRRRSSGEPTADTHSCASGYSSTSYLYESSASQQRVQPAYRTGRSHLHEHR